jgi:signal transduction histidine kinase
MKFRTQLISGIGALIVVSLFCGVMAVVTLHVTTRSAEKVTKRVVDDLQALHEVRLDAEQLVATARGYILTGTAEDMKQLERHDLELDKALEALRARNRPELAPKIALVEETATEYADVVATAVKQRAPGQRIASILENEVAPKRAEMQSAVDDLTDIEQDELRGVSEHAGRVVQAVGLTTLVGCVFGIAIGVVLAVAVARRLAGQYDREQEAARAANAAAWSRKELLDIVSHDLRSPLSSIVLGLDMLREEHPNTRYVSVISHSAERMQRMVNDLLDASRAEVAKLELDRKVVRPGELLADVTEQFGDLAKSANVELRTVSEADGTIYVDRQRILQVLANLVGNALKFTLSGSAITVAATRTGDTVRFSVSDGGPGIPDAEQDKVFDAYTQGETASRRGGIGLGLYICKKLVDAHGGRIGVRSSNGQGSTFWFEIAASNAGSNA